MEAQKFEEPAPSFEEGRKRFRTYVEAPRPVVQYGLENTSRERPGPRQPEEEKHSKGFFDKMVDAAKDLGQFAKHNAAVAGKAIAKGTKAAGKFVVDKTKKAATTVWEGGKALKVSCLDHT